MTRALLHNFKQQMLEIMYTMYDFVYTFVYILRCVRQNYGGVEKLGYSG